MPSKMEYTTCHPLLQFTKDEMLAQRKEVSMSNEVQLRSDIQLILDWFNKQSHLAGAGIDADTVERMMLQAKGSIERTKERIEKLYSLKAASPDLFLNRDTHYNEIDEFWSWSRIVILPKLYNGQRITIMQVKHDNSKTFDFNMLFKIGFMLGDFRLKHDYSNGDIYIIDLANTNLTHLAKLNPYLMSKAETIFHEGYGARIVGIHALNAPSFADRLLFLIKQTIKPKITSRIMIHDSYEDMHQQVPKEYLPSDYGGHGKSLENLAEMWRSELRSPETRQFFLESEKKMADESLRVGGPKTEQLAGSFRKLDFD